MIVRAAIRPAAGYTLLITAVNPTTALRSRTQTLHFTILR